MGKSRSAADLDEVVNSSFTKSRQYEPGVFVSISQKLARRKCRLEKELRGRLSLFDIRFFHNPIYQTQIAARQDGGLAGDYQWLRLSEIARLVRNYRPTSVIEFGCGTSSAMFASLIGDQMKFSTVEESEHWLKRMKDSVGDLAGHMTTMHRPRVVSMRDGESVVHYDMDHSRYYDMVYVDGPTATRMSGDPELVIKDPDGLLPNADTELFWENGIYPRVILVDGRRATVRRLYAKGSDKYSFHFKTDFMTRTNIQDFSAYRYHTLMVRREGVRPGA